TINIVTGGSYTFLDTGDDSIDILLDGTYLTGTAVIYNTGATISGIANAGTGTKTLTPGLHNFAVHFTQNANGGGARAVVYYSGPDTNNAVQVIGPAADLTKSGFIFNNGSGGGS